MVLSRQRLALPFTILFFIASIAFSSVTGYVWGAWPNGSDPSVLVTQVCRMLQQPEPGLIVIMFVFGVLLVTIFATFLLTPRLNRRFSLQITLPLVFCFLGAGISALQLMAPSLNSAMPLVCT